MKTIISEVMTPLIHSVGRDQTLYTARELLKKYDIRHLPVKEGGKLVGIISERDIYFALAWENHLPLSKNLKVADILTPDPYCVAPDTPIREVVTKMAYDKIGCVLVTNEDQLVGIFTTIDACHLLLESLKMCELKDPGVRP